MQPIGIKQFAFLMTTLRIVGWMAFLHRAEAEEPFKHRLSVWLTLGTVYSYFVIFVYQTC